MFGGLIGYCNLHGNVAFVCGWRNAFECDFGVYTYLQHLVSICRHSFSLTQHITVDRTYTHTHKLTKSIYICVPSDLTEATLVSIHTQHRELLCKREWAHRNCLSSFGCVSLCPSWATMLARRLPFFARLNIHTVFTLLVVVFRLLSCRSSCTHTHTSSDSTTRFGSSSSLWMYECKFDIFVVRKIFLVALCSSSS